jgi:hypothetical protein
VRRGLGTVGLSVALLLLAASSASAAVISPPSLNFGPQPTFTQSAQSVTLTKESRFLQEGVTIQFYPDKHNGFTNISAFHGISDCPGVLTDSHPSCSLTVYFTPYLLGAQGLTVYTGEDPLKPTLRAVGVGTKPCKKKRKKKSKAPARYKKVCRGFPFFDPTN